MKRKALITVLVLILIVIAGFLMLPVFISMLDYTWCVYDPLLSVCTFDPSTVFRLAVAMLLLILVVVILERWGLTQ